MTSELEKLHQWLSDNVDGYVALCEAGSVPAGDAWVEGRSDRDIAIVVEKEDHEIIGKARSYLNGSDFDDSFHFFFINRSDFIASDNHPQAISSKFRGRTLFGEDVVTLKDNPPRELARELYEKGVHGLPGSIERRLLNAGYWSEEKVKDKFYQIFKDIFMYLAAKRYAETGEYPVSRRDVVSVYDYKPLKELLEVLEYYNNAEKDTIISLAEESLELLKEIKKADKQ